MDQQAGKGVLPDDLSSVLRKFMVEEEKRPTICPLPSTCAHTFTCTQTHTLTHMCTHTHMHMHVYTCTHALTHTHTRTDLTNGRTGFVLDRLPCPQKSMAACFLCGINTVGS